MLLLCRQFFVLLFKNFLLYWRKKFLTCVTIVVPVIITLLLSLGIILINSNGITQQNIYIHGPVTKTPKLSSCGYRGRQGSRCATIWYAPDSPITNNIIQQVVKDNGLSADDVKVFKDEDELLTTLRSPEGQNRTLTSLYFEITSNNFRYNILFNGTSNIDLYDGNIEEPNVIPELQKAIEAAILKISLPEGSKIPELEISSKPYPNPPLVFNSTFPFQNIKLGYLTFGFLGGGLLSVALMLFWVVSLYLIIVEKDSMLRFGMTMMGMKNEAYWGSWLTSNLIFLFITVISIQIAGIASNNPWFRNCNFFVTFILLSSYGFSFMSFGFLLSTFVSTPKAALILSFIVNAFVFIVNTIATTPFFVYLVYPFLPWLSYILQLYPPFNFAKVFADISLEVFISKWFPPFNDFEGLGYFEFKMLFNHQSPIKQTFNNIPQPWVSIVILWANSLIYLLLAWYFDHVLPSNNGVKKPLWFLFTPSYWGCSKNPIISQKLEVYKKNPIEHVLDENLKNENQTVFSMEYDESNIVRIVQLEKTYSSGSNYVKALKGVSLIAKKGTCLSLLGHNGAGKTTLISVLCGLIDSSNGESFVFGRDVKTQISEIRSLIGVCPQKDLFWPELTGYEHLLLFATLKDVPITKLNEQIKNILQKVKLYDVRGKFVDTYSGGMKRRMSVAMSMIGHPEIVFLDEPTTGLDPKSKRDVWKLIEELKKDRLVILTTHSMEEADALADKIAIMAFGKVVCLGDSLYLKNTYGHGYSLNIMTQNENSTQIINFIQGILPEAKIISSNSGSILFNIPANIEMKKLIELIGNVEKGENKMIRDWGLSQTTLEEVYLTVTKSNQFGYGQNQISN